MFRTVIAIALTLACLVPAAIAADELRRPIEPAFVPSELHRIEAAAKASALARMRMAVTPNILIDQSGFDAVHYRIEISINEVTEQVSGVVTMTARARTDGFDSPTLNLLADMIVDSVQSEGAAILWSHLGGFLYATLPQLYNTGEEFAVTVFYHGHPTEGGFQGFAFDTHLGTPIISTLSEPYMAQSWWPCKDTPSDKADSVDMIVTVNSSLYAVSNGLLRDSVDNLDGTTTYTWHESYPITTYLVSLAITNYARFTHWYHHGADSMPVDFFSYPEVLSTAQTSWPVTVTQIGVLADIFGEYPFVNEKYGIAHFPWGGAMEHQTVSSHTNTAFGFDQYLIVHELSHQWWGDMITCRDWHHIWLNEGFASYSEALWAEHLGGPVSYRGYMGGMQYFSGGRIYIDDTTSVGNIFSSRVYDKGAWVLHMLRGVIGDDAFFELLRTYYADPRFQYKDAVTEDLRDLAEAVSGQELDWFFDQWIYGYYYPQYYYSSVSRLRSDGDYDLFVHLRQAQTTQPQTFVMPVELTRTIGAVSDTISIWNGVRDQDLHFIVPASGSVTGIDPDNWILDKSFTEAYGLQIISDSLIDAYQYAPYFDSLFAVSTNPALPITLSVVNGALPPGLVLDGSTGRFTGTTTDTTDVTVLVRAASSGFANDHKQIRIRVHEAAYMPGDQNADRSLDIQDVVGIIDYVFRGGNPPTPLDAADPNGDCVSDLADVVRVIDFVWRSGPVMVPGCIE